MLSFCSLVLWGVVNNAGTACWGEVEWVSLDRYKRLAEVNLWGMIRVTKAFLPLIRQSKGKTSPRTVWTLNLPRVRSRHLTLGHQVTNDC